MRYKTHLKRTLPAYPTIATTCSLLTEVRRMRTPMLRLALVPTMFLLAASYVAAEVQLPGGKTIESVDFERHVMGILGRAGCAGGGCHGSFQGKGGLRLSLFGYEPEKDFVAITRDSSARRINPADPDNSLLLLKATGQVDHGGSVRFGKGTWQYNVLREWIRAGARG